MMKNLNGFIVPVVMYIIAQTGAGIWWSAQIEGRVSRLEADFVEMNQTLKEINETLVELNLQLERMTTEHDFLLGQQNRLNNIVK